MRILFVDTHSSTTYTMESLPENSPGGTTTAMMLAAEALSKDHEVLVAQAALTEDDRSDPNFGYLSIESALHLGTEAPDAIIIVRKHRMVEPFAQRYPKARMVLWLANFQKPEVMYKRRWIARNNCVVVAMSGNHRDQAATWFNHPLAKLIAWPPSGWRSVDMRYIYNAISDDLQPDDTPVNSNKLTMFSTANKGLAETLASFERARSAMPELELYAAVGSFEDMRAHPTLRRYLDPIPGVHMLGRLSQPEILQHVRESLCVFYPQYVYPETFGLVYAEANAVGTPMLAHDFGAAGEVVSSTEQLVDGRDVDGLIAKLIAWRNGARPVVQGQAQFRATNVAREWATLLESMPAR